MACFPSAFLDTKKMNYHESNIHDICIGYRQNTASHNENNESKVPKQGTAWYYRRDPIKRKKVPIRVAAQYASSKTITTFSLVQSKKESFVANILG